MNTTGKCKCGEIHYEVTGEALQVLNCHCTMCREMNGSAFSTYVVVPSQAVRLVQGASSLAQFAVTERASKHFCRHCATPLFNTNPTTYPGLHMLYLGSVRDGAQPAPALNIYCDAMLPWLAGIAELRSFAEGPRRARPAAS